jgi:glutamyl-tRNA synthetase
LSIFQERKRPVWEYHFFVHAKVLGTIKTDYKEVDDFVILRSNGKPLYLLCNVVDDIRDRITHIIRGQDHMTNTLKQVLLYEALNAPLPVFAHIPLTMDTKRSKISKRSHGEIVAVQYYKEMGFLPWAFNNFLALLGWSSGDDQEIFSREELIDRFTLERINKSHSIFNFRKNDPKFFTDPKAISINEYYLRNMDIEELAPSVEKELQAEGLWQEEYNGEKRQWFLSTLDLIRPRFHTLKDFCSLGRAYFSDDYTVCDKAKKKNILKYPELKEWLPQLGKNFSQLADFTLESTEETARQLAEELGVKPGVIINGMRTVLTGQLAGPSMFDILMALGKEKTVERLLGAASLFTE